MNQVERIVPEMLKENNLFVNATKTEKYHVSRHSDNSWKKGKLLGSLFDTEEDIKRRKGLAIDSLKALKHIFDSRHVSEAVRLRVFKAYIESIFLYNSVLWILTKSLEDKIDSFQRKLLRKVIRVYWPRIISNESLHDRTHMKPWSVVVLKRRLSWFGHLMRLPPGTPAKQSLSHFIEPTKRPIGRPKTTWLSTIMNDLKEHSNLQIHNKLSTTLQELENVCSDRKNWTRLINSIMLSKTTNVQ